MSTLTARQEAALADVIETARGAYGVEIHGAHELTIKFHDQTRQGRGHDINFNYADSDHVVAGYMDVYGSTQLSVGEVDWTHNSGDEQCDCAPCHTEREADA